MRSDLLRRWLCSDDGTLPQHHTRTAKDVLVLLRISPMAKLLAIFVVLFFCSVALIVLLPSLRLPSRSTPFPGRTVCQGLEVPDIAAPQNVVALVTSAYTNDAALSFRREKEYSTCLKYFFEHFGRVYGLAAADTRWTFVESYPWSQLEYFQSRMKGKSAKESEGLQFMVNRMHYKAALQDDDIVVKASGRYQIVRSDFLEAVLANPDHDVWGKTFGSWRLDATTGQHVIEPGDSKLFTFCWAMRWRYFRDLYQNVDIEKLESYDGGKGWLGYDIESYVMDYVREKGLRLYKADYLHVIANIDNRGFLAYF